MNLADISIRRPVVAIMLIAAFMVFGMVSYPRVGVDLYPEVDFPVITITVPYPGADPETMERNVAEPIEDALSTLGGVRTLQSINSEGVTQVIAEFELEVNGDKALQDVRDKVSRISSTLPEDAETPTIDKFDIGAAPILTVALASEMPLRDLTLLADKQVKDRIQRISGVGGVDLVGGSEREIHIEPRLPELIAAGLTVDDLAAAVRAQHLDMPGGNFESGTLELSVKTRGQVRTAAELADIRIPNAPDPNLRLRDVATVTDSNAEARSASFLNGAPAVSLIVRKQSGSNTVAVAEAVRSELDALKPTLKEKGVVVSIPTDNSVYIARSIHDVQFDLVFGAALAVIVIFIFLLNGRATLISAFAIPTSVVATFAFISVMDFTFNNMTMLALSLAIGVLVDDAIVVIENIHRHLEEGAPPMEAASKATKEIFVAVVAMTSTIIAVFVPVALMKGIVGRFFLQFGLTVSFAVAMSMLVSFTLTPMMASRMLKRSHGEPGLMARIVDGFLTKLENAYSRIVSWSLRYRWSTLGLATLTMVGAGALVTQVDSEFVPAEDRSAFQIDVELPPGTRLNDTTKLMGQLERDLRDTLPGIQSTLVNIGGGVQGKVNEGSVQVNLVSSKKRPWSQQELMAWVRERYKGQNVKLTVGEASAGGGGDQSPVQLNLRGDDMPQLIAAADALKAELEKKPGFVDVATSHQGGRPEVSLSVDRDRAGALGVPVSSVASTIRTLVAGQTVGEIKEGGEAFDIILRLPPEQRSQVQSLGGMQVRSRSGTLVDLENVVHTDYTSAPTQISRQARQRQVTVTASLEGLAQGPAVAYSQQAAARVVPEGVEVSLGGNTQIMEESFLYMIEALMLAVLLVYMILAAQFNSMIQPITIMVSLPLSVVGAFGALFLTGMTLSIFSMIGVIMLMGLVTKNAILLVDFANQRREAGSDMYEALVEAGRLRLRPILMTALSMVFGMLPVALAISEGGEARAPMAVCVIGGMITSTVLTLVVVPVVYTLMDGLTNNRLANWLKGLILAHPSEAQ